MTKAGFIRNNRGIDGGKDIPEEFLGEIYDRIVTNEIKMESPNTQLWVKTEKKGWLTKRGGRIQTWKRRWFVLADNVLYYFKSPESSAPCGIIPLGGLMVRTWKKKHSFELFTEDKQMIMACKMVNGATVQGHHDSYVIAADNPKVPSSCALLRMNE